jgi:hypothetical protein
MKQIAYACFGLGGLLIVGGLCEGLQASAHSETRPVQANAHFENPQGGLRLPLRVEKVSDGYRVSGSHSDVSGRYVRAGTHQGYSFYRRTTLPVRHLHFSEHDQNWKIVDNVKDIRVCFADSHIVPDKAKPGVLTGALTRANLSRPTPTTGNWGAYSPARGICHVALGD